MRKSTLKFDKLNKLGIEEELDSLDLYYSVMQIGEDDRSRRRELCELLTDAFLYFFAYYEANEKYQVGLAKEIYEDLLADKVSEAVSKVTGIDSYMSDHIREMSKQIVNTTFKNTEMKVGNDYKNVFTPLFIYDGALDSPKDASASLPQQETENETDVEYWLSYRRAEDIAKSEANTFLNYTDFVEAKESGRTKKTWLTMLDDKVRETHTEVEGQTIGIDEYFTVGDSLMRFPHDLAESPNPQEVIGCRCSVAYS